MKKITAYINTTRVHHVVEELTHAGVKEVMVTEYFSPTSQISRAELAVADSDVEVVRGIIHRFGTTGSPADHAFFVEEFDAALPSSLPVGKRTSKLEEIRVKQLVTFLFRDIHRRIPATFLFLAVCVVTTTVAIAVTSSGAARAVDEAMNSIQQTTENRQNIETGMLTEMLAAEQMHRGESVKAFREFSRARAMVLAAIDSLAGNRSLSPIILDSLHTVEHLFHLKVAEMFLVIHSPGHTKSNLHGVNAQSDTTHARLMQQLDESRNRVRRLLRTLEKFTDKVLADKREFLQQSVSATRTYLVGLSLLAIASTIIVWYELQRHVAHPLRKLVEEAKTIDTGKLQ